MKSSIIQQDVDLFVATFKLSNNLKYARFLITGATGLVGSSLLRCLISLNLSKNLEIKLICPVRNIEKAQELFPSEQSVQFIEIESLSLYFQQLEIDVDYIFHLASPTSSDYMISHPVETFQSIVQPTQSILDYAHKHNPKKLVYASSIEIYGSILDDAVKVTEDIQGYINPLSPRSSYPMGKRAAESICYFYAKEYHIPVSIARLTQTFGAGIAKEDNRVFAQMARSVLEGNNIILKTQGQSAKPYCYLTDTVSALLFILLKGVSGEAYNIANPDTYITIRNMGEKVCQLFGNASKVIIEERNNDKYAPETRLCLDTTKLFELGWAPLYSLDEMYERLIKYLHEQA